MIEDFLHHPQLMPVLLLLVLTLLVVFLFVTAHLIIKMNRAASPSFADACSKQITSRVNNLCRDAGIMNKRIQELQAAHSALDQKFQNAFTHIGLIRFSAFVDTGSDLSFSLALLNNHGDGVVVTSLYGRDEGRVYAKPVQGGSSTHALSEEEKQAITQAQK